MRAVGIILAGGNSNRMRDLTRKRAAAAMPIAGSYRAIDFALSNICLLYTSKRQEKTEPEKLLEEITPEGEKASVEKLQWEYAHKKADLKEREIEYANIQEQIEELDEVSEPVKEIEKNRACVQFAIEKLEELSGNLEKKMGDSLKMCIRDRCRKRSDPLCRR